MKSNTVTDALQRLWIWQEPGLSDRLSWYRQVAANHMPAKFRIARHIPVELSLADAPEETLWEALDAKTPLFLDLWHRIRSGQAELPAAPPPQPNLVDLCRELSQRMLRHCNFCRWNCQVDRSQGAKFGTCKLAGDSRVSSYFHHLGEELIYRGRQGSGTIFFTSCNMRCAFCQNGDISTDKDNGVAVSPRRLATIAWLLRMEGCHNINWVGGEVTIHLHTIVEAISLLDQLQPTRQDLEAVLPMKSDYSRFRQHTANAHFQGVFNAPLLWNSNFFMTAPTMKILRVLMDVWLPDLKFGPGKCGVTLSRTPWYWETVTGNMKTIYDWGEDFTIRHLVMPNHVECCTRPILAWIAETMPDVPVNVMDQYHPDNFCAPRSQKYDPKYQEIARRPTAQEIRQAFRYAQELGLDFETLSYEKNATGLRL
jgi:putative pyruvate formate lyase activating enzyme